MAQRTIRVIMNGVTGRMGYRQHLVRSVLAIRDDGGVGLPSGERITVEPILVGRNAEKLASLAVQHGVSDFTTDLDEALEDGSASVYFDAQVTSERKKSILKAIGAGKHIYTEKPIAESVDEGIELVTAAAEAGVINGVVHDKLYLPGLVKLKRLIDSGCLVEANELRALRTSLRRPRFALPLHWRTLGRVMISTYTRPAS